MKKTTIKMILVLFLGFTGAAVAQSKSTKIFTPSAHSLSTLAPEKIAEKNNIVASLITGKLNEVNAYGLTFHNNGTTSLSFSWTLKDPDGKVVSSSTITINGGQTIYPMSAADANLSFPANGRKVSDYSIEINFK